MQHQLKDRYDKKWGHPEAVADGFWATAAIVDPHDIARMSVEEVNALKAGFRAPVRAAISDKENPLFAHVEWKEFQTEHGCPEEVDAPPVPMLVGFPDDLKEGERLPAVFCITGGGLTGGATAPLGAISTRQAIADCGERVIHVCFEYRIAPEWRYPAAVNDCHAAYEWMVENADMLQIDTDRIVIHGGSTGGHLSLCLAFRLKRYGWCGAPMPRGAVIYVPIMDDVALTDSANYVFVNPETGKSEGWDHWCTSINMKAWLGDHYGEPDLSPEAVPNRATIEDVKGLMPIWIPIEGEFEPGRDSLYKLVQMIHQVGVFCELHVWGANNHGGGGLTSPLARRQQMILGASIKDAIQYDFRRPWLLEEE